MVGEVVEVEEKKEEEEEEEVGWWRRCRKKRAGGGGGEEEEVNCKQPLTAPLSWAFPEHNNTKVLMYTGI